MNIHLRFNRNQDTRTSHYNVYRSTQPVVNKRSLLVMKIHHPKQKNPVAAIGDPVERLDDHTFSTSHTHLFQDENMVLYLNGDRITDINSYDIDFTEGLIAFHNPINEMDTVTADYLFDGIYAFDYSQKQEHVTYYGPPAIDMSTPEVPGNVAIALSDYEITLSYDVSAKTGQDFYYVIEAANTKRETSALSSTIPAHIIGNASSYFIEKSTDNEVTWETEAASHPDITYVVPSFEFGSPTPLQNVTHTIEPIDSGTQNIHIDWTGPVTNEVVTTSPIYRIRAKTEAGSVTNPSASVGPELMQVPMQSIRIRRKVDDGTQASFNDTDAETLLDSQDLNTDSFTDLVSTNEPYTYSLFTVDEMGTVSNPVVIQITL